MARLPELRLLEPRLLEPRLAELLALEPRVRRVEDVLRDREPDVEAVDRLRERRGWARWSLGTSALTSALTSRGSSPVRYLAIRSSSPRMLLASRAVSRSPTSSAKASMRV